MDDGQVQALSAQVAARQHAEMLSTERGVPHHLTGDLVRLAVMEMLSLIALRLVIEQLFGIDVFDFSQPIGKLVGALITATVFIGLYKAVSIDGKLQEIGESVIHGHGAVSL